MTPSKDNSSPSPRIVVVNDDAAQLNELCGLLHRAGLEALAFKSAESALAAMAQDLQPDLIVTDVYLPGIDGWRFCRLLRSEEYKRFNLTPILVVSATFSGEEPSRITADLGANAFLSMPVDGQQFIEQIRTLLKGETPQAMLKALIVEDSKLVSSRLVKAFQAQGYQAHAALTYQAALSTFGESAYDVAVIDYHLPDGLGDGLMQALREKSPDCVCLMMTADPQPELALTWMKMGAAAYLHKPFEPEYLIALCERARRERALVRSQNLLEMRTRQLHESEQKYRSLIQYSSDPIFAFNPDESYRFVNEAFARPFGKKPEEIIGKTPHALFSQEEAEKRLGLVRRVFATCENEEIEVKVVTHTGDERYYLTLADPIKDDRGKVLYVTCISKDITERKRVTDALRESEERYRTVVEWSPEPFVVHRDGKLIFANTAAIHLFGASSAQDLLGKSIFDLIHPDFHQITRVRIKRVVEEGLSVPVIEMRYLRLDRTPIDVEIQATSIIYDGAQANLVAIRDISARKRAEQALREEENLLKQLASFTEELLITGPEQITYQKILENLLSISKAKYGAFTLLNESTGKYTTVAVAGLQESVKKITKMLGFEPVGKEWNEYSTENEQLKGKVVARFASMSALAGSVIPEMISRTLEKLLNTGEVTVTKVIVNDQMIGDFTLIMPAGKQFENDTFVEIYSRQIDMFMTRIISDAKLKESEEKHRFLIENSHDIIYTLPKSGIFTFVSPAWTVILGHPPTDVLGKSFQQFVHPDDLAGCLAWLQKMNETGRRQDGIEYRVKHANGTWRWHTSSAVPLFDERGAIIGIEGTARDITERKQAETELRRTQEELESAHNELQKSYLREQQLARIDDLTGINNHRSLLQLAEREFDVAMRYRPPLSMMFFDIDYFKQINDTFGHAMGDQALKKMIEVVCADLRRADVIGRYGGDEFVILMPQTSAQEALPFAERIHVSIASMSLDTVKGPLTLTISIGIAQTVPGSDQLDTVENLLLRADQALYAAKEAGRNRTVVFDPDRTGAG